MPEKKLNNTVFAEIKERGYVIVENLLPKDQVTEMAAARRLKPWQEVKEGVAHYTQVARGEYAPSDTR
ncbi:MAG: hypothetical protein ACI906_003367 [Candidatus Latescibacterota bacterium]|jgi:hypothetical protein